MNIKITIRMVLIQATLTQMLIFGYNWYAFKSLEQAAISTAALVLFTSIFGLGFGIILLGRISGLLKMVVVSFLTSLLVTITFIIYPELGLVVEWYILFGLMFVSGLIAYALSYESQRRPTSE